MLSEEGLYSCWWEAGQSSTDAESYSRLSLDSLNSCLEKWSLEGAELPEQDPPLALCWRAAAPSQEPLA